jgi:predicted TIM-barrel fold metal-dependent hydrolase
MNPGLIGGVGMADSLMVDGDRSVRYGLIDCDVHAEVPSVGALLPYLSGYWVEQINNTVFKGPVDQAYPPSSPLAVRPGSRVGGGPPTLDSVQQQVLTGGVDSAIINCTYSVDSLHNPEQAVALAGAVNDWQIAEWLDKDSRLRGSIVVPIQVPSLAAREIERVVGDGRFAQVLLPARSQHPYGNRIFHPVWEAAERHGLPIGIHFGGAPGNPPTAVGWPSYYIEEYVGMAAVFAAQLTSLVCEGVFDLFPSLRVTLLESGVSWLTTHLWRFDKEWKNLRRQVPWVKRPPSEYIREHVRLTIQPFDGPAERGQLLEVIEQLGSDDMLLYSSDYPHQHAMRVEDLLLKLPSALVDKVMRDNAEQWYRL